MTFDSVGSELADSADGNRPKGAIGHSKFDAFTLVIVLTKHIQRIHTSSLARHCHEEAYAAVVLAGGYEEAGDNGRFQVAPGDVILHDRYESHLDRFSVSGAVVLNLCLTAKRNFIPGCVRVDDPEAILRASFRSPAEAVELLFGMAQRKATSCADWPDDLATALIQDPSLRLSLWAAEHGLAPWTLSRGFGRTFGVPPETFRARTRARQALKWIQATDTPFAQIAYQLGFADQAHMTREVKRLTGLVPKLWRANRFKTGDAEGSKNNGEGR
jgi:AraC-like DNA-binding protein